jgi:uncharacterized protein (DUF2141 family)
MTGFAKITLACGLAVTGVPASRAQTGCTEAVPSIEVHVTGFKDRAGQVRAELYSDSKDDFLASHRVLEAAGKIFHRIDTPTPLAGEAVICMPVPKPGRYSMVILHDRNGNGKLDGFSDGFGFPGNPKLSIGKPDVEKAVVSIGNSTVKITVVLNYLQGFSIRPWKK